MIGNSALSLNTLKMAHQIALVAYSLIVLFGLLFPEHFVASVYWLGDALFSRASSMDRNLYFSISLLLVLTFLEFVRNFSKIAAIKAHTTFETAPGGGTIAWAIKHSLFPVLIILYFISSVLAVSYSDIAPRNWNPISSRLGFLWDLVTIWLVAFSCVNLVFILLTLFAKQLRK